MKKTKFILGVLACSLFLVSSAWGDTDTATLNVAAKVIGTCDVTTEAVSFTFTPGTESTAEGNINVACNPALTYTIALNNGVNPGSNARQLKNAGTNTFLEYLLYQPTLTNGKSESLWGDGTTFGNIFSYSNASATINDDWYVFGVIESDAEVTGESYSTIGASFTDSVTVTVTY